MINKNQVVEALKSVKDPEIGIDVYTLGLIYNINIDKDKVNIRMTLTSPACPYGPELIRNVKHKVSNIKSVENVDVELVFNPPWRPSDELRAMLGV